jgi:DNA polymerase-3 subunit epsilon
MIIFDVETTGVDVNSDRVIELAAIKANPLTGSERLVMRFNPGRPVPDEAIAVHGITNDALIGEPSFADCSLELLKFMTGADIYAGYNVNFDLAMLASEFARVGLDWPPIGATVLDAYKIYTAHHPRTLDNAFRYYTDQEPDQEQRHSALYDVQCTLDVLMKQAEICYDIEGLVLQHGETLLDPAGKIALVDGEAVFTFGKHQGQRVLANRGYAEWMLGADFAETTKNTIRALFANPDLLKGVTA